MIKSSTGEFLESCKWAHDKLTWRDVKYVINGRSGGAGTSKVCVNKGWREIIVEHEVKWESHQVGERAFFQQSIMKMREKRRLEQLVKF